MEVSPTVHREVSTQILNEFVLFYPKRVRPVATTSLVGLLGGRCWANVC